jgi:hypothetical protein
MTQRRPVACDRLWVVTPVYFDVESFHLLREHVLDAIGSAEPTRATTFVVIDDSAGSDEAIGELAHYDDVRVIGPPYSLGHQRALVLALRTIAPEAQDTDVVVTLDADGEDRPEDIPRLLAPLDADPENIRAIVIAQRTTRHVTVSFRILYAVFRAAFRLVVGSVIDSGNFAAFRGWAARRVVFHPSFDVCYSSSLVSLGLPVTKVPCARGERYAGQSRMTYSRLAIHGLRMLVPFLDRIVLRALVLFTAVLSLSILGLLAVTGVAIAGGSVSLATPLALAALVLLSLGVALILLSVFSNTRGVRVGLQESAALVTPDRATYDRHRDGLGGEP